MRKCVRERESEKTWTVQTRDKREENRLLFWTRCRRRIFKISWVDEEVFRRAGERRSFLKGLKSRRVEVMGHMYCDTMDS